MPRPPILPTIPWEKIFQSAKSYEKWLQSAENPENRDKMEAWRKKLVLPSYAESYLAQLARPVHVVAIAEDWCGDVVRHVPCLMKIADVCSQVRVRFIHRADHPDVFVRYLTNGGEAIPKFVFLNEGFVECGNWGPMPEACRELIARGKACNNVSLARQLVAKAYDADAERKIVFDELLRLVDIAASQSPDPAESLLKKFLGL